MSHEVALPGLASFCILPSAFPVWYYRTWSGDGQGAVWYWSGGGLTWIVQGYDIKRLTRLALWLWVLLAARCIDGEGTGQARRAPVATHATNWE